MMLMMINGEFVEAETAAVSAWNRGLYFGDGVYEVMRCYNGRPWGFEQHFRRFERSLHEVDIDNIDLGQIRSWVNAALERAAQPNCTLYFHVTRGCGLRSHVPGLDDSGPQFLLYILDAPDNTERFEKGISAITYPDIRWQRCDIKSLNLLPNVMAARKAAKSGAHEALFVMNEQIIEGASSCFFAVVKGHLTTPKLDHHLLPSVTRQAVLAIAEMTQVPIDLRNLTVEEAYAVDELFVASSGYEIRPLIRLDDVKISNGAPGPITQQIIALFVKHTRAGRSFDELVRDTRFELLPE